MTAITGTPEEVLARVQQLAEEQIPGIVCELQAYKTQIGCGSLDGRGALHEIKFSLRDLNEYLVESQARAVATHYAPRRSI